MKKIISTAFLILAGMGNAAAITIDFESVTTGEFSEIIVDGYRFSEFPNYSNPEVFDAGGDKYISVDLAGECGPFGNCGFVSIVMTREDGGAFSFLGADITDACFAEACFNFVRGNIVGGGTAIDPIGTGDWLNLTSVEFIAAAETDPGGFGAASISADNIVVNAVPVPAAVWLFGSALAGLGWIRRKRTV